MAMQLKRQLTDRRSAAQLRTEAQEQEDAGFRVFANLLWDAAAIAQRREDRLHGERTYAQQEPGTGGEE
jgi:hypothetical protein